MRTSTQLCRPEWFLKHLCHTQIHTGASKITQSWCSWRWSSCSFEICWSLFISVIATESHLAPKSSQPLNFLIERMLYPPQVCKTLGKLMLMAINKCNQVTSECSQALTQNIFQIKSCDTDKGHLPEINIWKQTPECSRLTLVTMLFTFTTSNICNNWALFYPMCDTRKETWTI